MATSKKCRRDKKKQRKWEGLIEQQAKSGQSVVEFCRTRDVSDKVFYWWRKVLSDRKREAAKEAFIRVEVDGRGGAAVEVELRGDRRVVLRPGFDEDTLRRAVSVLEGLGC